MLGQAYLQKARETGDPGYYPKAETLFQQALAANGDDVEAMVGLGTLALARHEFAAALDWGERARDLNPYHAAGLRRDRRRPDRARPLRRGGRDRPGDGRSPSRPRLLLTRLLSARADGRPRGRGGRDGAGGDRRIRLRRERRLGPRPARQSPLRRRRSRRRRSTTTPRRWRPCPGYAPALAGQARVAAARGDLDRAADALRPRRCGPSPCRSSSSRTATC